MKLKRNTLILATVFLSLNAYASGGYVYNGTSANSPQEKPDLRVCVEFKDKFGFIKKILEKTDDWDNDLEEVKILKEGLKLACKDAVDHPNAHGKMAEYNRKQIEVARKVNAMKQKEAEAKRHYLGAKPALERLEAKTCDDKKMEDSKKLVEDKTKKEYDEYLAIKPSTACGGAGGSGPVAQNN